MLLLVRESTEAFEIHSSFKFATVVAAGRASTDEFSCAFYLHDDEWLFGDRRSRTCLRISLDFVHRDRRRVSHLSWSFVH